MKRKLLTLILALVLPFSVFAGCKDKETTYTMYVPDGAPLLAVANIVHSGAELGSGKVSGTIVTGAQIGPALIAKTPDIALAPINVCAQAYNNTDGEYVLCGVAVWGLNFIVSKDEGKTSLSDFVGETIYAFQEAGTPGLTLKALIGTYGLEINVLAENGAPVADKINILFLPQPADVRTALTAGYNGVEADKIRHGLLSEPLVTAMQSIAKSTVDTQKLWQDKSGGSYPQVGLVIKKSIIEKDKEGVDKFVDYVLSQSQYLRENPAEIATLAKVTLESDGLPAVGVCESFISSDRGKAAFDFGKIESSKSAVEAYIAKLVEMEPKVVGGKAPDSGFYLG